ncbi:MAG: hypothetical protein WBA93_23925 [Microcoleaceae cyanobacterium]
MKEQFWVIVIESQKAVYSVEAGLAQMLVYMLGNPHQNKPGYGLITSGGTFTFIKLVKAEYPHYTSSNLFATINLQDLYRVMQILKSLSQIIVSS